MKKQYLLPNAHVSAMRVACVISTSTAPTEDVHNEKGPMGQLAPSRPAGGVTPERMSN